MSNLNQSCIEMELGLVLRLLFCPSHNCGYDADGDSGQEGVQRPGYRGELHPGYLHYILPAAYLLHSHRVLVLT